MITHMGIVTLKPICGLVTANPSTTIQEQQVAQQKEAENKAKMDALMKELEEKNKK